MEKLHSNQFTVNILPPTTIYGPVDNRKYTLFSDKDHRAQTLTIGLNYSLDRDNMNRDDILTAEWRPNLGVYELHGKVFISGGQIDEAKAKSRYHMFQTQLPGMIASIIKSDFVLFQYAPWLLDVPIYVKFDSHLAEFNTVEYYGTPRSYLM